MSRIRSHRWLLTYPFAEDTLRQDLTRRHKQKTKQRTNVNIKRTKKNLCYLRLPSIGRCRCRCPRAARSTALGPQPGHLRGARLMKHESHQAGCLITNTELLKLAYLAEPGTDFTTARLTSRFNIIFYSKASNFGGLCVPGLRAQKAVERSNVMWEMVSNNYIS